MVKNAGNGQAEKWRRPDPIDKHRDHIKTVDIVTQQIDNEARRDFCSRGGGPR